MRICFIEDTKLHGGTQLWVFEAIKFFLAKKQNVTVLTPNEGWLAQECRKNSLNVSLYTYKFEIGKTYPLQYFSTWTAALRESDIVICTVHPPRGIFHCTVFASECIKENNLSSVKLISKTGTIVPEYRRNYYLPYESENFHVITITDFTRKYLIKNYTIPSQKIEVIYQGIDTVRFSPKNERATHARNRFDIKNSFPIVGCIGSLEERKGHIILLKAVLELRKTKFPNIHLLVVGDGSKENELKKNVKTMSLEDNVTFIPFMKEIELIYELSDIIALPSMYKEGLPNVILEAMAMRKPVIATNVGGVAEIVKNTVTGLLIEPRKIKQLIEALTNIIENTRQTQEMVEKARKMILKNHDRQIQLQKYLDYFESLVKSN